VKLGPKPGGEDRASAPVFSRNPGIRIRTAGNAVKTASIRGSTTAPARMSRIIAMKRTGKLSRTIFLAIARLLAQPRVSANAPTATEIRPTAGVTNPTPEGNEATTTPEE
jgi:hypothetical protein